MIFNADSRFWTGARDVIPFLFGGFPFGLLVGVLARQVAVPAVLGITQSALVFGGTAQIAGLNLIEATSPIWVILVTTLFINLRMMMYSVTMAPYFKETPRGWQLFLAYFLTDQAFAFSVIYFDKHPDLTELERRQYYLGVSLPVWLTWMVATAIGVLVGGAIPPEWGIDFAIPLVFMGLVVPALKSVPGVIAAVVGLIGSVLLIDLPLNTGLLVAIVLGMVSGRLAEIRWPDLESEEGEST